MICSDMTASQTPSHDPAPTDAPPDARTRAALERGLEVLSELVEIGLGIARALGRQAAGKSPVVDGDVGLAFSRVSRAVRMTVMLQGQVIKDLEALDQAANDENERRAQAASDPHAAKRETVRQVVGRMILDQHHEIDYVKRIAGDCRDMVESETVDDLLSLPVSDIVGIICWNLNLSPDWTLRMQEPWVQDEIDSGHVGESIEHCLRMKKRDDPPEPEFAAASREIAFSETGPPI